LKIASLVLSSVIFIAKYSNAKSALQQIKQFLPKQMFANSVKNTRQNGLLLAMIMIFCLLGCNEGNANRTKHGDEPAIYHVQGDDQAMNGAIGKARRTLQTFIDSLKSGNHSLRDFTIKMKFKTAEGHEHIWLNNISFVGSKMFGVVNNLPEQTREVNLGETVEVTDDKITDWMFIEDGKLRGGYTIRVLFKDMSEKEKKEFEQDCGFIVEGGEI